MKLALTFCLSCCALGCAAWAQDAASAANLPDSPGFVMAGLAPASGAAGMAEPAAALNADADTDSPGANGTTAKPYLHRVVGQGLGPQPLTSGQKIELSFRSRVSFGAFGSSLFGAGERQLLDSRPHYGTDSAAFGERLGAAELKQVTDAFFSYGAYAVAFHQDPHYYVKGRGSESYLKRAVYAATRIVLTRTDSGATGVNYAKLLGVATATGLTNTYYPARDVGFSQTVSAYFSTLGTSALTLEIHEFLPDLKHLARHKKAQ